MQPIKRYVFRRGILALLVVPAMTLLTGCDRSADSTTAQVVFQRLNSDGSPYTGSGDFAREPWACVRDPRTDLVWEVKSTGPDLRSRNHTYSWYEPELEDIKDQPGVPDGGTCSGSPCDTRSYTLAVRAAKLCGFDDWRVPGHAEISSINDLRFRDPPPTIDPAYFPATQAAAYWTITTYGFYPESAWSWQFDLGHDRVDWKREPKYLRLVRGTVIHKLKKKR